MSDIIYTPPASSGGGQNPTTNYIPLNNGTSNFVDSYIFNDKTNGLLSFTNDYGLTNFGLVCDVTNSYYSFGDFINGGTFSGTQGIANVVGDILASLDSANKQSIFNDGQSQIIKTSNNNNDIGLKLDFATDLYSFADFNSVSSGTSFYIDVASSLMYTKHSGQQEGLFFDFVNDYFQIGDFAGTNNGTYLTIDDDNQLIQTFLGGAQKGIKLNNTLSTYSFGDFNIVNNGTNLLIDDASTKITFYTEYLNFVGATLQNGATVVPVGKNLIIVLNGIQYHIPLYN
jgi:hypothetical protein